MLKKSISIIVVFLIIFSLSGCVPISVIPKLNQMKQDATSKLNNYLNTEYENYEIIDVQQFTDTKNLGTTISDITKIIVKIDAQEYNFYYNHSNDKIYSNYYNNNISTEILDIIEQHNIPTDTINKRGYITMWDDIVGSFEATLCEDKTLNDVIKRMKSEQDIYTINADFYYEKKESFTPYDIRIDTVFKDLKNLNLNLYNVDKRYLQKRSPLYLTDLINYKMCDDITGNIEINYHHTETKNNDGLIFLYDNEFYDLKFKKTNNIPKDLNNPQSAYEITVDTMKEQPPLYNEFLNNIGTKTIIYRERVNYVSVFLETSKWQGCNFYFSQCDEIKPFASLDDDLLIFNSFIEDVENYTETIVVFS